MGETIVWYSAPSRRCGKSLGQKMRERAGEAMSDEPEPRWTTTLTPGIQTLPPLNPMSRAPRDGRPIVLMLVSGATVRAGWSEDDMGWQVAKNGGALRYFVDGELMGWWPTPEVLP